MLSAAGLACWSLQEGSLHVFKQVPLLGAFFFTVKMPISFLSVPSSLRYKVVVPPSSYVVAVLSSLELSLAVVQLQHRDCARPLSHKLLLFPGLVTWGKIDRAVALVLWAILFWFLRTFAYVGKHIWADSCGGPGAASVGGKYSQFWALHRSLPVQAETGVPQVPPLIAASDEDKDSYRQMLTC